MTPEDDSQESSWGHWLAGGAFYGKGGRLGENRNGKLDKMKMSLSHPRAKCQAGRWLSEPGAQGTDLSWGIFLLVS